MSIATFKPKPAIALALQVSPQINFEISDLFYYLETGHTPTGIQRVQQELCSQMVGREGTIPTLVLYDRALQKWRVVPVPWFTTLIATARNFRPGTRSWLDVYHDFASEIAGFPLKQFQAGDWLVNVGASWSLPSYFIHIRQLRRRGVKIGLFLHDCIPARHPSYFNQPHTIEYTHWLAHLRECADVVVCNSEATLSDYKELVKPHPTQVTAVCRLDASLNDDATSADGDVAASELLSELGTFDDDFVLCVGTVEPRKNHLSLIHVWDRLRQTHGGNCPKLLCVGRIGWKSDAVMSQAAALGLLNTRIHFITGVSDDVLQALYRKCLFSVYVSYYEGWGLPISESLAAGKVCVAGKHSSLMEAGAGFAIHVDERSETSIYDAVVQLLDDPEKLANANRRVRENYEPRGWDGVDADLFNILAQYNREPMPTALPVLEMNTLYNFGHSKAVDEFDRPRAAEALCTGHAWHRPEDWGTWSGRESAELAFRVDLTNQHSTLFLRIMSPPGGTSVSVSVNGKQLLVLPQFAGKRLVRIPLEGEGAERRVFPVRIRVTSSRLQNMREIGEGQDGRILGVGYLYLVAFERSAVFERIDFVEKMLADEL